MALLGRSRADYQRTVSYEGEVVVRWWVYWHSYTWQNEACYTGGTHGMLYKPLPQINAMEQQHDNGIHICASPQLTEGTISFPRDISSSWCAGLPFSIIHNSDSYLCDQWLNKDTHKKSTRWEHLSNLFVVLWISNSQNLIETHAYSV